MSRRFPLVLSISAGLIAVACSDSVEYAAENYAQRTLIVEALESTGDVKVAIATFAQQYRRYPSEQELMNLGFVSESLVCSSCSMSVVSDTGQVVVAFDEGSGSSLAGTTLTMTPPQTDLRTFQGPFSWSCETTLPTDFAPSSCRAE